MLKQIQTWDKFPWVRVIFQFIELCTQLEIQKKMASIKIKDIVEISYTTNLESDDKVIQFPDNVSMVPQHDVAQ